MLGVYPLFPVPIAKVQYSPEKHKEFKDKVLKFIKENKKLEVDGITSPELKHFFNSSELAKSS